ncbi:MAG: hypothetical protein KGI58_03770 [Patescibacteria group bacterium]|nr:hypothetical protein [Patescibacteria group bacterium]
MKKFLIVIAILFLPIFAAQAADVSLVSPSIVGNGQYFTVAVYISTDSTPINSFDITISYPKDIVSFKGYKEDGSIKKMWIVSPVDSNNSIHFVGIIPGGVDGVYDPTKTGLQDILITKLIFSAKNNGQGDFNIVNSTVLKNDGQGTSLPHNIKNTSITITQDAVPVDESSVISSNTTSDSNPDPFTIKYIDSSFFSKTPDMIVFSANDKDSGIKKYQVKTSDNSWKDVSSPLPVVKGIIKSNLIIRAIDYNGNAKETQIEIPGIMSEMELLIILLVVIGAIVLFRIVRKNK